MLSKTVCFSGVTASPPPSALSTYITPTVFSRGALPNGAYTTPSFTAYVVGGTGPYTYEWSADNGVINTITDNTVSVGVSGYNESVRVILNVKVTDSLTNEAMASATIFISFGNLL